MELFDDIRSGALVSFDAIYHAFVNELPLLRELQHTPQDPQWHAEGDVHIHTSMVVEEIHRAIEAHDRELTPSERLILVLGAALHDIGKPLTTAEAEIDGKTRIVARRHDTRGRSYLAYRLATLGLDTHTIEGVLAIVGHHHDPKRLLRRDEGKPRFRRLARLASLEHLYLIELADMRGRTCDDKQEQLDIVELFRMQAEEHGVYAHDPYEGWKPEIDAALNGFDDQTRRFVFGKAMLTAERGDIVMASEEVARSYGYRDEYAHLIVMCGPSGSGKSTWIAKNAADYAVVSLDEIRAELTGNVADQSKNGQVRQLSKERLRESLRANRNVVWDATNLRRDFRRLPIELGYDYGAFVTLVVLQPTIEAARQRNQQRERSVPEDAFERQFATAEFPFADEAHEVIFVTGA